MSDIRNIRNNRNDLATRATTATEARATTQARATTATNEAAAITDAVDTALTARDRTATSRLAAPSTPTAGAVRAAQLDDARTFANVLDSMRGFDNADQATAEFMKVESEGMSTNMRTEGMLNRARSILREMAFTLERRLRGRADELRSQAAQAEERAMSMAREALASIGVGEGSVDPEGGVQFEHTPEEFTRDLWSSLIRGSDMNATEAARLRSAAADALRRGDRQGAAALQAQAEEKEEKLSAVLERIGINPTPTMVREMETIANERAAAGQSGGVLAEYLRRHPEVAQQNLSAEAFNRAMQSADRGQALLDALIDKGLSTPSEDGGQYDAFVDGVMAASEGGTDNMLAMMRDKYPGIDAAMPQLEAAAEAIMEAVSLANRANLALSAQNDALQAIAFGRSAEGTHGVAERNARGQREVMRSLEAMTNGSRLDQELRDEAAVVASASRQSVSRMILEAVERGSESSAGSRRLVRS